MAEEKKKQKKVPTAEKRKKQSDKKRIANRSFKSQLTTAIRSFTESLSDKERKESAPSLLQKIYSLMDKGVKKGVYPKNKAARIKARNAKRLSIKG